MDSLDLGTLFWDYKNVDRDTAYRSLVANKPRTLYKYRSGNKNSIDDFKDEQLWFNDPLLTASFFCCFFDIFDCCKIDISECCFFGRPNYTYSLNKCSLFSNL